LDPAFSVEPALHVRDHVILAVFDNHIRAAIQSHRLFIFDHESKRARRATEFVVQRLSRVSAEEAVPFEFVALEALLMATCADIEWMMRNVEPLIERELGVLSRDLRRSNLERLRVDERRLSLLLSRARNFEHLLEDILDEDEDMSHMYLTEMRYHPEKYRLPTDHEDVELLLENALQTVQSQVRRLELLDAGINNLEEILEIKLDISQNRSISPCTHASSLCITGRAHEADAPNVHHLRSMRVHCADMLRRSRSAARGCGCGGRAEIRRYPGWRSVSACAKRAPSRGKRGDVDSRNRAVSIALFCALL
jgi:hypothetical protein